MFARHALPALLALVLSLSVSVSAAPPSFSNETLQQIRQLMLDNSNRSWEIGTCLEAVLQLEAPELSVFGAQTVPATFTSGALPEAARKKLDHVVDGRDTSKKYLIKDGAAADPASIGFAVVLGGILTGKDKYVDSSADELDWLLHDVPKADDDVISHRQDEFQAWSDFVSMVPPFFAYYGVAAGGSYGRNLLKFAHHQIKGYRDILRDQDTNLWRHVARGGWSDDNLWLTGNGWAAHGALRVQQTIVKSEFAQKLQQESDELLDWTNEILEAAWQRQRKNGLLGNYLNSYDSFDDAAGTALVVAATYRHAVITGKDDYIPNAEKAFRQLIRIIDSEGWLTSVTDPYSFSQPGQHSPEGQSFLIYVHSASQAYYATKGAQPSANVIKNPNATSTAGPGAALLRTGVINPS